MKNSFALIGISSFLLISCGNTSEKDSSINGNVLTERNVVVYGKSSTIGVRHKDIDKVCSSASADIPGSFDKCKEFITNYPKIIKGCFLGKDHSVAPASFKKDGKDINGFVVTGFKFNKIVDIPFGEYCFIGALIK